MASSWGVVHGEYSDYRVDAICSTAEVASALADRLNAHGKDAHPYPYRAEEFEFVSDVTTTWYGRLYHVTVNDEGTESTRWSEACHEFNGVAPEDSADAWRARSVGAGACSTRGFDVALKAARDALARLKAETAGIAS